MDEWDTVIVRHGPMSDRQDMTTGAIIDKVIEIRDFVDAEKKAFEERIKPFKEWMAGAEIEVLNRLNAEDAKSAKSQSGAIAFKVMATHVKVNDKGKWMVWAEANWDNAREMFTSHISKEAIKSYVDSGQQLPDGVEMTQIWGVNFRRG